MTQSMKFKQGSSSVDVSEMYDDRSVRIEFWNNGSSGYVDFDERRLRELRKWLTIQIRKMKPTKKK